MESIWIDFGGLNEILLKGNGLIKNKYKKMSTKAINTFKHVISSYGSHVSASPALALSLTPLASECIRF